MVNASATKWISERAGPTGFAMAGVVRAEKFPELARQEEWLARGYAGEMKYLSDARRSDPQAAMPGVRSVIVCALTYNTEHPRTAQAWQILATATETQRPPRLDFAICMGRRLSRGLARKVGTDARRIA